MKEIGKLLKDKREENGVLLLEAAEDLQIDETALENMEEGNIRAFKDMYVLKELIKDYAKYLGLDVNDIVEEFNDFLFEHTSKISLKDIENTKTKLNEEPSNKVASPYTKIPKPKKDYREYIKIAAIPIAILILLTLILVFLKKDDNRSEELQINIKEDYYELT